MAASGAQKHGLCRHGHYLWPRQGRSRGDRDGHRVRQDRCDARKRGDYKTLQESLDKVGRTLAHAALAIVGIIVGLGLYRGQPFMEMLIFGIALAVAAVPEALPTVVTISLTLGVQRMVQRNALVRRLPAVETLGSTSVICSGKTGTLTKDEMTARQIYVAEDMFEVSGAGFEPRKIQSCRRRGRASEPLKLLLRAAALTSDARLARSNGRWQIKGDPTEGALVVLAAKAGLKDRSGGQVSACS